VANLKRSSVDISDDSTIKNMLLDNLIEKSLDAIVVSNAHGQIQVWNNAAQKIFGWSATEIIGERINKIFHGESLLQLKALVSTSELKVPIEVEAKSKSGIAIPVCVSASEVSDTEKNTVSYLYIIRDQRDAVERDKNIKEKIQALESFAYSVSHDLRAPLRRIVNYAEILQEDHMSSLNEEVQRIITRMAKNTQKMSELIDDLLSYSRLAQLDIHKSVVDMNVLVSSVIEEYKQTSDGQRVTFVFESLHPVYADRILLKNVISNLISNAVKFSRPKENPIVQITSDDESAEMITYCVKDNGVGFDMQYASKLFSVFQRLHNPNAFEGNGMGLATVQQIIARHNGKVSVDAKIDEGAVFSFSIPKISN
jgi:PAS domain S-box-containing protein